MKFFKADQNFGYITVQGDKDYKVGIHATYNPDLCEEDLKPGTEISFVPRNVNGNGWQTSAAKNNGVFLKFWGIEQKWFKALPAAGFRTSRQRKI